MDKIYIDMDGVIADFDQQFYNLFDTSSKDYEDVHGSAAFWAKVYECPDFFRRIPQFDYTHKLIKLCESIAPTVILSSPSRTNTPLCVIQKRKWIDIYLGYTFPAIFDRNKSYFAQPNVLLIDDTETKIQGWKDAGGVGYLFTGYPECVEYLETLKEGEDE